MTIIAGHPDEMEAGITTKNRCSIDMMTFSRYFAIHLFAIVNLLYCTAICAQQIPPGLSSYEKYIDAHADSHIKEFIELVSIPGISSIPSHKPDIEKSATWIVNKLKTIGIPTVQEISTQGNPVIYGSWDKAPGKPTVLIYAHYDVQPVKESEWNHPPFAPVAENGKIYGRGSSDDKSGVMITICAVEAMLKTDGRLPVNVKFMFDGEEEIGSPNFRDFLIQNKDLLKADYALNADGDQFSDSIPSILMSLRGGVQLEFSVKTANIDAHSGQFGGKTPNAVVAMSQIITSLFDSKGNVAIAGFYDRVLPLSAEEKAMIAKIPYNKEDDMNSLGTTAEVGDTTYSPLERIWYRPTLEIIGMQGGYTAAEGYSNIIPGNAMARITCRLVNNQNGKEIIDLIVKHINAHCPVGATVTYKYRPINIMPMKFPAGTKAYDYISDALKAIYGKRPLQIATGGSVGPLIDIREQLGIYAYSLGFELPDERWHSANEYFRESSLRKGQLVYCYYLQHLAGVKN